MTTTPSPDYRLTGEPRRRAIEAGLASATWYRPDIPRRTMKQLMRRSDGPGIRDTLLWFGLLGLFGTLGVMTWGTVWTIPCFMAYGVLYGTASDSRWHECGHGTAFKTRWMNDAVYQLASFMVFREGRVWKWSHARHHTDTLIVGRDYEINAQRPTPVLRLSLGLLGLPQVGFTLKSMMLHATGRLTPDEQDFIPASERPGVIRGARLTLALHLSILAISIAVESWFPAMLVGVLPSLYGAWLGHLFGLTQHAGLAENVLDHRLNSRTVRMNPVFRFLYWNMNYHIEHHIFPMVPYHALPRLHALIRHESPPVYPSMWAAYREILPALWRQRRDPTYCIDRLLPAPYQETPRPQCDHWQSDALAAYPSPQTDTRKRCDAPSRQHLSTQSRRTTP